MTNRNMIPVTYQRLLLYLLPQETGRQHAKKIIVIRLLRCFTVRSGEDIGSKCGESELEIVREGSSTGIVLLEKVNITSGFYIT